MVNWFDNMSLLWAPQTPKTDTVPQTETAEKKVVTVPLVATEDATQQAQAKLTEAGNVPLVNAQKTDNMGLGIEKTTAKTQEKTQDTTAETTKSGVGLDKALTKFYGKKYTNASDENKEKMIVKYFDWLSTEKKDVISQLDQFKLYRDRSSDKNGQEYKRLCSVIDKMEAKYQYSAAETVMTKGSDKQKAIGQETVADDYQNYDKSVQLGVTGLIVDSKNEKAIKIGASHASQLAEQNQTKAVGIYEKADIADTAKKEMDKILVDQYGQYAKSQEVGVHTIMSQSKFSETVEYAASNIYKFDKENQAQAVKITAATGNEKAINAAASQYAKYDQSAQDEIKSAINTARYQMAQETSAKTEANSVAAAVTETKTSTETSSATKSESSTSTTMAEQVKALSGSPNAKAEIQKIISQASDSDKINLLKSLSATDLVSVINSILSSSPSVSVLSQVKEVLPQVDSQNRTAILKKISDLCPSEFLYGSIGSFDASSQLFLAQEGVRNGKSRLINENLLSNPVRAEYKRLLKENIG